MREATEKEMVMYDILRTNKRCRDNNYEAVREWYRRVYGINLPSLENCEEQYGTVERWIRALKALYPDELTDGEERQLKADMEEQFKDKALDRNKPVIAPERRKNERQEQLGLGLLGGQNYKDWW